MNTYEFLKMAEKEVADSLAIIRKKGESYGAAEDVFFNFRQTAARMFPEMPIHEGMFLVAEILKDKHSVALAKGMYVNECRERLLDNLNYTLFQLAMIAEAEQMEEFNTDAAEDDKAAEAAYTMPLFVNCKINPEAVKKLDKIINETTEELRKTFEAMGNRITTGNNKPLKKGAVLGAWCGNCKNQDACDEGEKNGNETFPDCRGVFNTETGEGLPVGSPLANWEPVEGALPEVAPEPVNEKPAGLTWGMLAKVRVREDGTLFLSSDEKQVDVSGLKKEPVIRHGCGDCNFNCADSTEHPCKDCKGWQAESGDELPCWEPANG